MTDPQIENGFILISRKLIDSRVFQNEKWLKVWIWCLLKANHKDQNVLVKTGKGKTLVKINRGQFIYGRKSAAEVLEMPPSTIRNIIALLANWQNLDIKPNNHYSIITIINYKYFQDITNYKRTSKRTGKGQPKDTNNNDNNDNNIYSPNSFEVRMAVLLLSFIKKRNPNHKEPNMQKWARNIDLMGRKDHRSVADIEKVIRWCQTDNFWCNNILSTEKLRKQFDQLRLKMMAENEQSKNGVVL